MSVCVNCQNCDPELMSDEEAEKAEEENEEDDLEKKRVLVSFPIRDDAVSCVLLLSVSVHNSVCIHISCNLVTFISSSSFTSLTSSHNHIIHITHLTHAPQATKVKQISKDHQYPMIEEYDFHSDTVHPSPPPHP